MGTLQWKYISCKIDVSLSNKYFCEISYILLPFVTNSISILLEKISLITSVGEVGVIQ